MDLLEQAAAQIMLFEQVAEATHVVVGGDRLAAEVDADETTHRTQW